MTSSIKYYKLMINEMRREMCNTLAKSGIGKYHDMMECLLKSDNESVEEIPSDIVESKPKVLTEDLGKIFEMAICKLYDIEYDGKYKYSHEDALIIKDKIFKLKDKFPYEIKHTAKGGSKYDFTYIGNGYTKYLSAKTSKKDGKVCPQLIGQPSKKRFCELFELSSLITLNDIKEYIITNITDLLKKYILYTFNCSVIYYNKAKDLLWFIELKENNSIKWEEYDIVFSHITKKKDWNESSTISISNINIGEFQVHNNRDCIKFRWMFEKLLNRFKNIFDITDLNKQ